MRWYLPSHSGDFRLEPLADSPKRCALTIMQPTLGEVAHLRAFFQKARKKGWTDFALPDVDDNAYRAMETRRVELAAPVGDAGAVLARIVRPRKSSITAFRFAGGRMEITEGTEALATAAPKAEKDGAEAAASVQRPTPSCPQCEEGAVGPASEVLLEFLTPAQHADWSEHRAIVVEGCYSGHRYLLAHRKTTTAARIGRICYDLDSKRVVHFHDSMVPPEEEVLAAKLILEHREDWLRNEATLLGFFWPSGGIAGLDIDQRFKNPFGDIMDGVADAHLTQAIGGFAAGAAALLRGRS